ncbi:hypothetical protein [Paenibacillus sp. Marseille-Q4541]|uniref:hypothetical protein n=1 Tax=Paenibacillus sp. Marseille-Q4541 TaxID=2831522 RepID=UPI001BAD0A9C|nr:hypothetical protein [Paenibacillus sp. Marseille-Q4541]
MKKRIYMVLLVVCLCFFLQDKLVQPQEYLNDQMEQQFRNANRDQLELALFTRISKIPDSIRYSDHYSMFVFV